MTTAMNFDEMRDFALPAHVYPSATSVFRARSACRRVQYRHDCSDAVAAECDDAPAAVQPRGDARTRTRREIESMHRAACRIRAVMYSDVATAIRTHPKHTDNPSIRELSICNERT